jgi:hypothetical protein
MFDDNDTNPVEVTPEAQPNPEQNTLEKQPEVEEVAAPQPAPESQKERNFRLLRERTEQAERERDEAMRILREIELRKHQAPSEPEEPEPNPTDYAEWKHVDKYVNKKVRKLEEQFQQQQQQLTAANAEVRLKSQYPDFDKVVSKDNVDLLKATYPELAATLNANPDLYTKAVSAYTMIKQLGLAQGDDFVAEKAKAQQNAAKPRPLASVSPQQGDSPLSKANAFANGLTPELKAQLLKEMMEAKKNF